MVIFMNPTMNAIDMGAKLVGAVGALAPTDFVVSKSWTYYTYYTRGLKVSKSLVCMHPHFLRPIGALGYRDK